MRPRAVTTLAAAAILFGANQTHAAALQVAPVRIQVDVPAAASTITVSNPGSTPITAQLRVYKWTHKNGKDELVATRDVVASPPLTQLAPGQPYVVRIVRVVKQPVNGEEAYRLLVDEIPSESAPAPSFGPRFAIRQSIPVFFTDPAAAPKLSWGAAIKNGKIFLEARNEGGKRVRISALKIMNSSGGAISVGKDFAGYVFGRSTEQWTVPAGSKGFAAGGTITILAQGENGPIKATARISAAN